MDKKQSLKLALANLESARESVLKVKKTAQDHLTQPIDYGKYLAELDEKIARYKKEIENDN
jgi:hypothetical protein